MTICLHIPEQERKGESYPGNIKPGDYDINGLVALLRKNKCNPKAIQFIADMLER
jgi:hypothetical protein